MEISFFIYLNFSIIYGYTSIFVFMHEYCVRSETRVSRQFYGGCLRIKRFDYWMDRLRLKWLFDGQNIIYTQAERRLHNVVLHQMDRKQHCAECEGNTVLRLLRADCLHELLLLSQWLQQLLNRWCSRRIGGAHMQLMWEVDSHAHTRLQCFV